MILENLVAIVGDKQKGFAKMRMARLIWKKSCAAVICGTMLCAMFPSTGFAESADTSYYCDENDVRCDIPQEMVVVENGSTAWNGGDGDVWYVVTKNVEISERVEVSGAVNLVLCDGVTLTVEKGIHVTGENSLTIYGQEAGDGGIDANAIEDQAALGGNENEAAGYIQIYGGTVTASGGFQAAGIGGGNCGSGGYIEFAGECTVEADGGEMGGAGIGGGWAGSGGNIVINGCNKIVAKGKGGGSGIGGGQAASGSQNGEEIVIKDGVIYAYGRSGGSGIGGGGSGSAGNIKIYGGQIEATGDYGGAGIGSGYGGAAGGKIVILGGKIVAIGSTNLNEGSAGIGGGNRGAGGSITISGAEVHATGGEGSPAGDGIGNGGGYKGADADVVITDETGCPLIYANSLMGNTGDWCGIVFLGTKGKVYGELISLQTDLTINKEQSLEIPKGTKLVVPDNVTLTNYGKINGEGTLFGDVRGDPVSDSIDDGKFLVTLQAEPEDGGAVAGEGKYLPGETVKLTAEPKDGFHFVAWENGETLISDEATYSMKVGEDLTLTAVFAEHDYADAWRSDEDFHWRACACGAITEREEHSGGTAPCAEKAVCETCGEVYGAFGAHELIHHDAVAAGCETSGSVEYWHCAVCGKDFADAGGKQELETATVAPSGHTLTYHARVAPTYDAEGRAAHYACAVCGELFLDAAAEQPVSAEALVIPKLERPQNPPVTPPEQDKPALEIAETTHGAVVVSTAHPDYGEVVTIVPQPDSGYAVEAVTVTDADGEALVVTALEDGTYQFTQPRGMVEIVVTFVASSEEPVVLPFVDVAAEEWYGDAVAAVYARGLMTGTAEDTFAPELAATRGMVVSILHRLAGSPTVNAEVFADVAIDDWYGQAVAWAASEGIASGTSAETFSPNAAVTREQLAALLCNFAAQQGVDTTARSDLSNFDDAATVSDWAQDAVSWAHAEGLIAGTSATTLSPQGEATRAQLAAMLVRFSDYLENAA